MAAILIHKHFTLVPFLNNGTMIASFYSYNYNAIGQEKWLR